jgi:hypothetical protein
VIEERQKGRRRNAVAKVIEAEEEVSRSCDDQELMGRTKSQEKKGERRISTLA